MQHGEGVHALHHVVSGRLAELLVGGRDVEQIVDDLEHHAVRLAETSECIDHRTGETAHQAADARRGGEQRGGLAADRREIAVDRAGDVVGVPQLLDLALAETSDRARQETRHLGAERCGDLGGLRQQEVTGEDRLQVAPLGVHGFHPAAGGGFVHHVVVVQGPEVHELAGDAALNGGLGGGATGRLGGDHRKERSEPFSARQEEVRGDLGEIGVGGLDGFQKRRFHAPAVVGGRRQFEQRIDAHSGQVTPVRARVHEWARTVA